jgi:hypothetical protein
MVTLITIAILVKLFMKEGSVRNHILCDLDYKIQTKVGEKLIEKDL